MTITLRWDDEERKSLLIMQFEQDWLWGEFQQAILNMLSLKKPLGHPVDVILDVSASAPLSEFDGMTYVWWLLRQCRNIELGYYALVTQDPILRVVANVVRQTQSDLQGRLRVAEDLQEAREILAHLREQ